MDHSKYRVFSLKKLLLHESEFINFNYADAYYDKSKDNSKLFETPTKSNGNVLHDGSL